VYDRKKTATASKEAVVELRISYERKSKYISTGVSLLPKQYKGGRVTNRADMVELNESLDLLMVKARKAVNTMMEEGDFSLEELPRRIKASSSGSDVSFIEYCKKRVQVRIYGKSDDTKDRYERFLKWLKAWGEIRHFSDVTDENIVKMDAALAKTGMKPYSKWNNYHRFLNSFILDAIDDGFLKRNPYKWVHIRKDKDSGLSKYLTLEELQAIEKAKMPTVSLERVRDLFVFQSYTCLSYTDLASFDAKMVKDGVYTGYRGKTGVEYSFLLLPPAKRVLEKYKGRLPIISNVKYNEYLKLVAQAAKIDKPISTHWARHTGATILLNEGGVDMEIVSHILGHSSTKMTRKIYAKLLDKTVVTAMKKAKKKIGK
jgi:site-specific recombinase XerD